MSTPFNELSRFTSYRYYFVMVMCDTTLTADALSQTTQLDAWLHSNDPTDPLGKFGVRTLVDNNGNVIGKYCVLINGSTDATFVITNVKWTTATAADAVPGDQGTSIAYEGAMSVSEPRGILFMDQIVLCSRALGVDTSTVTYVLKPFFVGYTYGNYVTQNTDQVFVGGEGTEHITSIAPMQIIPYDVSATFTEQGGMYEISFTSISNGAARLPQFARVSDGFTLALGNENAASLSDAMSQLEVKVNQNYEIWRSCILDRLKKDDPTAAERFLPVKYQILLDPAYSSSYKVTNLPIQYKDKAGCDTKTTIKTKLGGSMEQIIRDIMWMSPQVVFDMTQHDPKYEYRVHSIITTTGDQVIVTYVIKRFLSPKSGIVEALVSNSSLSQRLIENNLITFDYIYSGKNIDVLSFDMKMNIGLGYLQAASTANTFKEQLEIVSARSSYVNSDLDWKTRYGGTIPKIPLYFGMQGRNLVNNTQVPGLTVGSAFTMAKHASLEVAEATIKIIGNTNLLNSVNRNVMKQSILQFDAFTSSDTGGATSKATNDVGINYGNFPFFAKINIFMPASDDDLALFESKRGDYAQKFWYDGYYYIYGIDHEFDQGEFTQTLHMVAVPTPSESDIQTLQARRQQNKDYTDVIASCNDATLTNPCKNPTSTVTGKPQTSTAVPSARTSPDHSVDQRQDPTLAPTQGTTSSTTRQDSNSLMQDNQKSSGPSGVNGWDKTSQTVRDAIVGASSRLGVDATTMAQFARIESNFNPSAKATTSSATGLYQHINSTWMGLVKQGKIPGIPATTATSQALALRTDPNYSALGGAALLLDNQNRINSDQPGDLYLAHFLGPNAAKKVINADNVGRGDSLLESDEVLGQSSADRIYKANPFLINRNIRTASGLRSWAATKMAQVLKDGIAIPTRKRIISSPASLPTPTSPSSAQVILERTAAQNVGVCKDCDTKPTTGDKTPCGDKVPSVDKDKMLSSVTKTSSTAVDSSNTAQNQFVF